MARGRRRETRRDVSSLQPPGTLPDYGLGTFLVLFLLSVILSSLQSYRSLTWAEPHQTHAHTH
jgi:hypothetical protein